MHGLIFVLCVLAALVIGALGHLWFAKEALATENELKSWRQRLDSAATADLETAKREMQAIATEIKAKF